MTGADRRETVLVVDDEALALDLYVAWLDDDYDVRTATSGRAAVERLDASVSAVVLDRRMPGMDGRDALGEIRDRRPQVPVAMTTAVEPDLDVVDLAFDEYVVKPVDRDEFVGLVERLLRVGDCGDALREVARLASKRALLEEHVADADLAASAEYAALLRRLRAAEAQVDDPRENGDDDRLAAIDRLAPSVS